MSFVKVEELSRLSGPPVWGVQNRYFRRTRTFDPAYCLNYQIQTQQRSLLYTGFQSGFTTGISGMSWTVIDRGPSNPCMNTVTKLRDTVPPVSGSWLSKLMVPLR